MFSDSRPSRAFTYALTSACVILALLVGLWFGGHPSWLPGPLRSAFVSKTANERPAVVNDFLKGLRAGEAYCHDAFADAEDKRRDGPTADEVIAIEAKYLQ